MSSHGPKQPIIVDPSAGHELEDVNFGSTLRWFAVLTVFVIASGAAAWVIYKAFIPPDALAGSQSIFSKDRKRPPEPTLQALPKTEMRDFREDEDNRVGEYTWSNKAAGTANIPLDKALEVMAQPGRIPSKGGAPAVTDPSKMGEVGDRRYDPSLSPAASPPVANDGQEPPVYPGSLKPHTNIPE